MSVDAGSAAPRLLRWPLFAATDDLAVIDDKLRRFLAVALCLYAGERLGYHYYGQGLPLLPAATRLPYLLYAVIGLLGAVCTYRGRFVRPLLWLHWAMNVFEIVAYWHGFANHQYLHFIAVTVVLALDGRSRAEKQLTLGVLRFLIVMTVAGSVLQKLGHGAWLGGEFLNAQVASGSPRFTRLYLFLGLNDEVARLRAMCLTTGAGTLTSHVPIILIIANLTWLTELALPVLLGVAATRNAATSALIAFLLGIQIVTRECFFAFAAANFLALFLPRGLTALGRWYWPLTLAATALSLAAFLTLGL